MVYPIVAVEAEEGRDDPAMCARAWWQCSEADTVRHHIVSRYPGQNNVSTR
jgi:hypothetical protein